MVKKHDVPNGTAQDFTREIKVNLIRVTPYLTKLIFVIYLKLIYDHCHHYSFLDINSTRPKNECGRYKISL